MKTVFLSNDIRQWLIDGYRGGLFKALRGYNDVVEFVGGLTSEGEFEYEFSFVVACIFDYTRERTAYSNLSYDYNEYERALYIVVANMLMGEPKEAGSLCQ